MIPESPIANEIYLEQAAANDKLQILLVGCAVLIVLIGILCWLACKHGMNLRAEDAAQEHIKAQNDMRKADLELAVELSKPCYQRDDDWWAKWCDRQELPESTRRVLLAGMKKREAA